MPGARLPHAWISFPGTPSDASVTVPSSLPSEPVDVSYVTELSQEQVQACQWSTLDLCAPDTFTLLLGARNVMSVSHVVRLRKYCEAISARLNIWRLGTDFDIIKQAWFAEKLNQTGGILVRPDQHIMMMMSRESTVEDVISILNGHLGK